MNAGIFGMANGVGGQLPRLIGIAGKSATGSSSALYVPSVANTVGALTNSVTTASGVRTRILSLNGRGLFKLFAACESGAATPAMKVEIFVDGVKIIDTSWTASGTGGYGPAIVGNYGSNSVPSVSFEPLPFSSSVEVFLTVTGAANPTYFVYLADLYQ